MCSWRNCSSFEAMFVHGPQDTVVAQTGCLLTVKWFLKLITAEEILGSDVRPCAKSESYAPHQRRGPGLSKATNRNTKPSATPASTANGRQHQLAMQ
jgi:hypothetical protein